MSVDPKVLERNLASREMGKKEKVTGSSSQGLDVFLLVLFRPLYVLLLFMTFIVMPEIARNFPSEPISQILVEMSDGWLFRLFAAWLFVRPLGLSLFAARRLDGIPKILVSSVVLPLVVLMQIWIVGTPEMIVSEMRSLKVKTTGALEGVLHGATDHVIDRASQGAGGFMRR